jgi:serine/threonine-protein kinase OSR1/STK39
MTDEASWPSSADQYQLEKRVGTGAFSQVWRARCPAKESHVAIKIMDLENINSSFEDIRQEVQMMRLSDHPNILRCYASFVAESQLWLVMQLMEKGSCLHVMTQAKRSGMGEGMKEDWLAYILRETLQGLKYFHDNGQIHRDVKAGNILLDTRGNVRLADFGVSGWLINSGDRRKSTKTFVGTPCWMAPEVMEQIEGYDYKADIWSFGITMLELAKGYAPYAHYPPMKVLIMTIQQEPPSLKSYADERSVDGEPFSRAFREVVRLCLQKDPKKRPTCTFLLNHKYFQRRTRDTLVSELLERLEAVGEGDMEAVPRLPGTQPAYISHENAQTVARGGSGVGGEGAGGDAGDKGAAPGAEPDKESDYVRGTTWVFEDGSQVILRPDLGEGKGDDDASFYDDFEANTGGENFREKG